MQYSRNSSQLMPLRVDETVTRRWGINLTIGSPILQISVYVPEYVWLRESQQSRDDNSMEKEDGELINLMLQLNEENWNLLFYNLH